MEEVWRLSSVLPSSASTGLLDNFTTCDLPRKAVGSTRTHSQWCNAQCMSATLVSLNCTLLNLTNIALQSEALVRNSLIDFSPPTDSSNCYSQCSSWPHDEWCNGSSLPTTTRNAPAIFWQIGNGWLSSKIFRKTYKANLGWICFPTSLHLVISEDQVTFHYIWEDVVIPELCPVFWGQALWTTGAASYWGSARAVVPLQWGVYYCLFETMHGNVSLCVSVRWCGGCPTVTGFLFSLDYRHNKV